MMINKFPWLVSLFLGLMLLPVSWSMAQPSIDPVAMMEQADQHYQAGEFGQAIEIYEQLHGNNLRHPSLYYNLGNAYFREAQLGQAIINYRRAQAITPRDGQINQNLEIARSRTIDQISTAPQDIPSALAYVTEAWLRPDETAMLIMCIWLGLGLFTALAILFLGFNRLTKVVIGLMLGLGLFFATSLASQLYLSQQYPAVVIIAPATDVTSGPGTSERYPVAFKLHDGTEAWLLDQQGVWYQILLPNNLQGWVPQETVGFVEGM
ncbi:hypothetical protein QUF64_07450 [Anaerolineales bacterium HSG6]|nr:hypothetical protein [Anaerolineales bacterium HSG6]